MGLGKWLENKREDKAFHQSFKENEKKFWLNEEKYGYGTLWRYNRTKTWIVYLALAKNENLWTEDINLDIYLKAFKKYCTGKNEYDKKCEKHWLCEYTKTPIWESYAYDYNRGYPDEKRWKEPRKDPYIWPLELLSFGHQILVNDLPRTEDKWWKANIKPIVDYLDANPELYDKAALMAQIESELIVKRADALVKALITGNLEDPLIQELVENPEQFGWEKETWTPQWIAREQVWCKNNNINLSNYKEKHPLYNASLKDVWLNLKFAPMDEAIHKILPEMKKRQDETQNTKKLLDELI
ncbi:hypothetical protein [Mesoplasma melaleucae]|uniref:Uncharacterized protein n=1 Tax=Mesoplasma melaleucae TaxID=81459 RepID=A0A2K8NYU1_9MOLU|nr:hypothetical protein [Mesoplasma melaleucae]ATZ17813.1 hypothetical protein EMELA_v1c02400 [Mesoplasma melaleucae]